MLQVVFDNDRPGLHAFNPLIPPGQCELMYLIAPEMSVVRLLQLSVSDYDAIAIHGARRMSSYTV